MSKNENPWKAYMLIGAIGTNMAVSTFVGFWLGKLMDDHFDTSPFFLLVGVLLGLTAGIYGVYRLVKPFLGD
ncbi:MAG TPA: AtpZ/AtpI family protein [Bacillales bacterium]|nr:AtpZ/AtpI family protein [Bacillales bacterium]